MRWDIDKVVVDPYDAGSLETLRVKGAQGWEPYAIDNGVHYFRRELTEKAMQMPLAPVAQDQPKKKAPKKNVKR